MTKEPIFFAWTRSFWLTASGVILAVFSLDDGNLRAMGDALAIIPGVGDGLGEIMVQIAPMVMAILALHQRSGAARPYTVNPAALK